jgi:hypothetical protein
MRVCRSWTLLILVYITVDFLDPSIPGVFFLDNDALFVDSVVHPKQVSSVLPAPVSRAALPIDIARDAGVRTALGPALTGVGRVDRGARPLARRHLPSSSPSSSPEDH